MIERIEEHLALLIDNTCWTLASMMELTRRSKTGELAANIRRWFEAGDMRLHFHSDAVQADVFAELMRDLNDSSILEEERLGLYDGLAAHYAAKLEDGSDARFALDTDLIEQFPLPV